jgi:hypothetical protein
MRNSDEHGWSASIAYESVKRMAMHEDTVCGRHGSALEILKHLIDSEIVDRSLTREQRIRAARAAGVLTGKDPAKMATPEIATERANALLCVAVIALVETGAAHLREHPEHAPAEMTKLRDAIADGSFFRRPPFSA